MVLLEMGYNLHKLSNLIIYEDYIPFQGVPSDLIGYSKGLIIGDDKKVFKAGD